MTTKNKVAKKERRFRRHEILDNVQGTVPLEGSQIVGEVHNVSRGSLFLSTEESVTEGMSVKVEVTIENGHYCSDAIIRFIDLGRGFSVEFAGMSLSNSGALWLWWRARLNKFVDWEI